MPGNRERAPETSDLTRSPIGPMAALFALFLLVLVGGAAIAAWKTDELALERQRGILRAALAADLYTETLMARDYAWWDDTQENAVDRWNQDWVDANLGTYLFEGFGYAATLVLDPTYRPLGIEIDPNLPDMPGRAQLEAAITAMEPALRRASAASWSDPLGGAGLVRIDQTVFTVAAAPVTPELEPPAGAPRPDRAVLALVKRLDAEAVVALGQRLLLQDLSLHLEAEPTARGLAFEPVIGLSNEPIGRFAWTPDRPGSQVIAAILPWAIAVTLSVVGLGVMILMRFTAQARALARSVETLQQRAEELEESRRIAARARDEAVRADQAKTSFLHAVTHELRSPLNAIIGFSELLIQYGETSRVKSRREEYLEDIRGAGMHLLSLINDILDLARIEDRGASLDMMAHDPGVLVQEPVRLMGPILEKKSHRVDVQIEAGLPKVLADPRAVNQILLNLLANATKFTNAGGMIRVIARFESGRVRIEVEDEGCGIPAETISRLGRPFEQVGDHWSGSSSGLGLGLAICRQLAAELGGTLKIESQEGAWTRVGFDLQLAPGAAVRRNSAPEGP